MVSSSVKVREGCCVLIGYGYVSDVNFKWVPAAYATEYASASDDVNLFIFG